MWCWPSITQRHATLNVNKELIDTFKSCIYTVEFQVLLLQVFDSIFVTLAKHHSNTAGVDCHIDLSQREQSLAVSIMTLQSTFTLNSLQLCSKDKQLWGWELLCSISSGFLSLKRQNKERLSPLPKLVLSKWLVFHHKQLFCQKEIFNLGLKHLICNIPLLSLHLANI